MHHRPPFQRRVRRFSADEVFVVCKQLVYSPCKKPVGLIQLSDQLAADLGYAGENARLLALKTNEAFQIPFVEVFTSADFAVLRTVQDHVLAVCARLARGGRFIAKAASLD